jgi:hypothetical protein
VLQELAVLFNPYSGRSLINIVADVSVEQLQHSVPVFLIKTGVILLDDFE